MTLYQPWVSCEQGEELGLCSHVPSWSLVPSCLLLRKEEKHEEQLCLGSGLLGLQVAGPWAWGQQGVAHFPLWLKKVAFDCESEVWSQQCSLIPWATFLLAPEQLIVSLNSPTPLGAPCVLSSRGCCVGTPAESPLERLERHAGNRVSRVSSGSAPLSSH